MENNNSTITARLHSDKSKHPIMHTWQQLTLQEAKELRNDVYFVTRFGSVAKAKVTSVKVWKTRPLNCDVHVKYGMYEFFTASYHGESTVEVLVKMIN